ncbi:hypothetical protein [Sphingobacterium suaedae]|uniref:Fimbrillin family protein n=1 Tax=Sphingobacterium suaedae TaxID=1686402 RepID=A0ABW5KLU7_9SPHI
MKLKHVKGLNKLVYASIFLLSILSMQSCKDKEENIITAGDASVTVNLLGVQTSVETNSSTNQKSSISSTMRSSAVSTETQTTNVNFSEGCAINVSLTDNALASARPFVLKASTNKSTTAITDRTTLDDGVKYQVIVYNQQGNYVTEQTFTAGTKTTDATAMKLNAGETYTFVAYSINSTTTTPNIDNKNKWSTAVLNNISADLMYFTTTQKLVDGQNFLNVVLSHLYSEITTNITMDINMTGAITSVLNPVIRPTHYSASYKVSDGTLTYSGLNNAGASVTFPKLGTGLRSLTSQPTLLIHPTEANGKLNFGSITIDGETKTNLLISGLKITPGHKYTLNLNFKTCTQNVTSDGGLNWRYPEATYNRKQGIWFNGTFVANGGTIEKSFTAPGADYGFVFDITELDNAFNMVVNGTKLASKEIQFQSNGSSAQNIRFKDKSLYQGTNTEGGTNIEPIWTLKGTTANPLIKVVISRTGQVTMYGAKKSGGPLYELEMFGTGSYFNTVPWPNGTTHSVKVTQLVDGQTIIVGTGSGRKKISCN